MNGMLTSMELLNEWKRLVDLGGAHASIRFGDASNVILAHGRILTMEFVQSHYGWLKDPSYCGITIPDEQARDILLHCLCQADFVGYLTQTDFWYFRPLFDMCLEFYRVKPAQTYYAFENNYIARLIYFYEMFRNSPVLLCGAKAAAYREVLERRYGWTGIVGTVDCPSWNHMDEAVRQMEAAYKAAPWKLALVCAGIPGKVLTMRAKELGTVGIDFGSGADIAIQADQEGLNAWEYTGFPDYWAGRPK